VPRDIFIWIASVVIVRSIFVKVIEAVTSLVDRSARIPRARVVRPSVLVLAAAWFQSEPIERRCPVCHFRLHPGSDVCIGCEIGAAPTIK